jgi:hypothetical protein
MKMRLFAVLLAMHAFCLSFAGCSSDDSGAGVKKSISDYWSMEKVERVDSRKLTGTTVAAHMEEQITPGKNLLFCSTFQLAWNELKDDKIKEDVHLTSEPPLVKFLNKGLSTKADISEDCYVAMAGFDWEGILGKVNKALKEKFGDEAPVVDDMLAVDSVYAYAYLQKVLRFKVAFESLRDGVSFASEDGGTAKVQTFGIEKHSSKDKHMKMAAQVRIPDYVDDSDFIITLASDSPEDEIILAKVRPGKTLLDTIRAVESRRQNGRKISMDSVATLQIPKLNLDIEHYFTQLGCRSFTNKGFEKYGIGYAVQSIRFKLDEKGAIVKSEARIVSPGIARREEPKRLIFDRPFLIYLKEKSAKYPYFALWVDNPELLMKQ